MFSSVGRAGSQPEEQPMTGQIYVRCPSCGSLSYDWRTGECVDE